MFEVVYLYYEMVFFTHYNFRYNVIYWSI